MFVYTFFWRPFSQTQTATDWSSPDHFWNLRPVGHNHNLIGKDSMELAIKHTLLLKKNVGQPQTDYYYSILSFFQRIRRKIQSTINNHHLLCSYHSNGYCIFKAYPFNLSGSPSIWNYKFRMKKNKRRRRRSRLGNTQTSRQSFNGSLYWLNDGMQRKWIARHQHR